MLIYIYQDIIRKTGSLVNVNFDSTSWSAIRKGTKFYKPEPHTLTNVSFRWLLKMAWRDSRRNRSRLLLFISSIIVGIAALVAINSFGENLQKDINAEAKTLIGADLVVDGNLPADSIIQAQLNALNPLDSSRAMNFISMVYFPKAEGARLAQVKALKGNYPFYGDLETKPLAAATTFRTRKQALVEQTMMVQYALEVGDSIRIGQEMFEIGGAIISAPGRTGLAGVIAPLVYLPMQWLEETALVRKGSRIEYQYYFRFPEETNVDQLVEANLAPALDTINLDYETVEMRKENIGEAFNDLTTFLNLVGFIALLLGCIGVASSVHIYIKDKLPTVAILRCLGTSGRQAFWIYLIQIIGMGLFGAVAGAVLGSLLQVALPVVLEDFLPIQDISNTVSWWSVAQGVLTGLGIAVLFALLPLLSIRKISPLRTLRSSYETDTEGRDPLQWLVYGGIGLFIVGFTLVQTAFAWEALFFPIGIIVAFLALAGMAKLLTWFVRKYFPKRWNFIWRQSIANLFRPNNQTLILLVTIGLGAGLISTLFFVRDMLIDQVQMTGDANRSNMILFDIQSSQQEEVAALAKEYGLPLLQQVPIVTMRLEAKNGETVAEILQDTTRDIREWTLTREYRVTYRDTLIDSEEIIEGSFGAEHESGRIPISMESNVADDMNAEIGTQLTFDVQGRPLETVVTSLRKVDFQRVQTNFLVVFPTGVLEKAPQFNVIVTRTDSTQQSARFQQALVQRFPNVSAIDLTQILSTINSILDKVSFVIRFMALFSVLTGVLVLISSVVLSKYQRIQESVLLRTIGASRRQILWINALEYLFLGSLAALTGIILAIIGSALLAYFSFDIPFQPRIWPPLLTFLAIVGLTVFIGLISSRDVLVKPPLEVLRKEL